MTTLRTDDAACRPLRHGRRSVRLREANGGAAAVEMALLMPVFLVFLFGICEFGRALWTQSALQYAVESAARCAVVNTTTCGTTTQIQTYAAGEVYGMTIPSTSFNVATPSCGTKVSISYAFTLIVPQLIPWAMTLNAQSCHP
jgi:Flp pilus assembly protein TadG